MRNLTTIGLGEKRVKSQSPLRIHSVLLGDVKELDGDKATFHEVSVASPSMPTDLCSQVGRGRDRKVSLNWISCSFPDLGR